MLCETDESILEVLDLLELDERELHDLLADTLDEETLPAQLLAIFKAGNWKSLKTQVSGAMSPARQAKIAFKLLSELGLSHGAWLKLRGSPNWKKFWSKQKGARAAKTVEIKPAPKKE